MDGYYFETTTDFASGIIVTSTKVSETELTLQFTNDEDKVQYIGASVSGTHNNIIFSDTPYSWTYDIEKDAYFTMLNNAEVFIGNDSKYDTLDVVEVDDNVNGNYAHIVQSEIKDGGSTSNPEEPDNPNNPDPDPDNPSFADTEVGAVIEEGKLGLWQGKIGEAIYFDGEEDEKYSYYFGSTTDFDAAASIEAVKVSETELTLEITSGTNAGKFIGAVVSNGHNNLKIQNEKFNRTYDADIDGYTAILDNTEVFIGSYNENKTFSVSAKSYLNSGENFVAHVVQNEISNGGSGTTNPDTPDIPSGDDVYSGQIPATNYDPIDANKYYENIDFNAEISSLKSDLHDLIDDQFTAIAYDDAKYILQYTDEDLSDKGYLYGVYDGELIKPYWPKGGGAEWNREHIWPVSRLPQSGRQGKNPGSDLFNLRASDSSTNGGKGNSYFSEKGGSGYYPIEGNIKGNDQRGDSARAIFYMAFKYESINLKVVENPRYDKGNIFEMGILSTLIEWNEADPVDEFEMRRNKRIYEYQGNRNPFVDYPQLVDKFF